MTDLLSRVEGELLEKGVNCVIGPAMAWFEVDGERYVYRTIRVSSDGGHEIPEGGLLPASAKKEEVDEMFPGSVAYLAVAYRPLVWRVTPEIERIRKPHLTDSGRHYLGYCRFVQVPSQSIADRAARQCILAKQNRNLDCQDFDRMSRPCA